MKGVVLRRFRNELRLNDRVLTKLGRYLLKTDGVVLENMFCECFDVSPRVQMKSLVLIYV